LFGIYIIFTGHLTPGGGFPGGVIAAMAFVLLTLAYGKEIALKRMSENVSSVLDSLGALAFLLIALLGLTGAYFFLNFLGKGKEFHLFSAGTIPLSNIAIGIKVLASLFGVFLALAAFRALDRKEE
jgi:multicomponent Na+:H+ antiporter subunit B